MNNDETRLTLNIDRGLSEHADKVSRELGFGNKATLMRVALIEYLNNHNKPYIPNPGPESGAN